MAYDVIDHRNKHRFILKQATMRRFINYFGVFDVCYKYYLSRTSPQLASDSIFAYHSIREIYTVLDLHLVLFNTLSSILKLSFIQSVIT